MKRSSKHILFVLFIFLFLPGLLWAAQIYPDILVKGAPWYDLRAYSDLSTALTAIGSSEKTLLVLGNVPVSEDTTIPANINVWYLGSGKFTIASGKVLTHLGTITADQHVIWAGSGILVPPNIPLKLSWMGNLTNAVSLLSSTPCTIEIDGSYLQAADITTPSTMSFIFSFPAQVSVSSSKTWTVQGNLSGSLGCLSGSGATIISSAQKNLVSWWPSLTKAVTDFGANSATLVVDLPSIISDSLSVPTNISLEVTTGDLEPAGGTTLTINGPFSSVGKLALLGSGTITLTNNGYFKTWLDSSGNLHLLPGVNIGTTAYVSTGAQLTIALADSSVTSIYANGLLSGLSGSVSITKPFDAGPYQVFPSGATVTFSAGTTKQVYIEWWGGGNGVDDSTAFLLSYNAIRLSGIPIKLLARVYYLNNVDLETVGEYDYGLTIEGSGQATQWYLTPGNNESTTSNYGTILRAVKDASYVLAIGPSYRSTQDGVSAVTSGSIGLTIKNLTIDGNPVNNSGYDGTDSNNVVSNNTCDGLRTIFSNYGIFQNVSFVNCHIGTAIRYTDRTRYDNCRWVRNTYGIAEYLYAANTGGASSGVSFVDCHTIKNDYNVYVTSIAADFGANFVGGYWAYATINDFYIVSGWTLSFTGVNFENPSSASVDTKDALFKIGRVYTAGWLSLENLSFTGCKFTDNSIEAKRVRIVSIVDSTNTTYPSLKSLSFVGNTVRNAATGAFCNATTKSQLGYGVVVGNQMSYTYAPAPNTIWYQIQESSNMWYAANLKISDLKYSRTILNRSTATKLVLTDARLSDIITNTGVSAAAQLELPASSVSVGYSITVIDTGGYGFSVWPSSGEQIAKTSGVNKYAALAAALGNTMTFTCIQTGTAPQWVVEYSIGTITYE